MSTCMYYYYRLLGFVLFLLFFYPFPVKAVEQDTQLWTPVILNVPLKNKWSGTLELQPRFDNDITDLGVLLVRPSLSYQLTKATSLSNGYLWTPNFHNNQTEQRIWQQVVHNQEWKKLKLTHQIRLEERFFEDSSNIALRGRYLITALYPIKESQWRWVASNELLVNLHDSGTIEGGLGQTRTFVGLRKQLVKNALAEGGYMLQYVNDNRSDQLNHVLVIRMSFSL